MTQTAAEVYRDYATDGVPGSGPNQVSKSEARALFSFYETLLGFSSGLSYVNLTTLLADIAHPAHTVAIVYNDANPGNNGMYEKYAVSGAGSWTRVGDLPNGIVTITPTGGTANAIVATANETPVVPATKLYLFKPSAPNTAAVTINVNGTGVVPIKNAFGFDLVTGSLLAGSQVLMAWSVDHYQLLISASVDGSAILAAAVAAQNAAAASATAADASASTAATYALVAGAASARFVRLKTTANDTLSGLAARDGVTPVAGDKVLAGSQTTASQNGIYLAAAGAWARPTDFNDGTEITNGVVVRVSEGTANANKKFAVFSVDVPIVVGTSLIAFNEVSLIGDANQLSFQQEGAGTVPVPIMKILREWHTLPMYGGGPEKTSAQNAAAFAAARDALLLNGGTLTVTPGNYVCDRVSWVRSDIPNGSMKIQGTANPSGPANNNAVIMFTGTGPTPFWNFDSPSAGSSNGTNWSVDSLYFYAVDPTFSGAVVSSTTPVTDASKITSGFVIQNCNLAQGGGVSGVGTLLDIGKTIITTVYRNNFGGGACQIKGQQGQPVAGVAQARQSTTVDLRKNTFVGCNGFPILYGGEGWGCYDNVFEASAGGRMRCFSTNANYPIRNMTWINNWCGDTTNNPTGDQAFIVYGLGFVFMGNYVAGIYTGGGGESGNGFNAIALEGVKGFNISGNCFDNCSAAIAFDVAGGVTPNYGSIEGNVINIGQISVGTFGAGVRIAGNGT